MSAESRVFAVGSHDFSYFTGIIADNRQVVMGLLTPRVVAYFFDADGAFQERETCDWEYPAPRVRNSDIWRLNDAEFQARLAAQIERWQQEIGFVPGVIEIQWFFDEELSVGIETLPESLRDLSWSKGEPVEYEMKARLEEWQAAGSFLFCWDRDYLMAGEDEGLKT